MELEEASKGRSGKKIKRVFEIVPGYPEISRQRREAGMCFHDNIRTSFGAISGIQMIDILKLLTYQSNRTQLRAASAFYDFKMRIL